MHDNTTATTAMSRLILRLWAHFTRHRRIQFVLLFVLIIVTSFTEILSIGSVIPFLSVLTSPEKVYKQHLIQPFIAFLGITSPQQLLLPLALTFGAASVLSGCMRLLLQWSNNRFCQATGADLSISIYRRTLYQPYSVHVSRNSSEVISAIMTKTGTVVGTLECILNIGSSAIMFISIFCTLLIVDPVVASSAFTGFGLIYIVIIFFTSKQLNYNGECIAHESTQMIKSLQEGLGGIRDVLIDGSQEAYCKIYRSADIKFRRAIGNNIFMSTGPRYAVESLGMVLIASLAYSLAIQPDGLTKAVTVLGVLALGAQRMLPILQTAYSSFSEMIGDRASLYDALEMLEQPLPEYIDQPPAESMTFDRIIALNNISFRYTEETPWVLKNLDLTVQKGSRIGFIGATGSGKSTLLDIVMGLLQTTEGALEIDGQPVTAANHRSWQLHIAHVPQSIFLADSTIAENIAFGIPSEKIDFERVKHAAKQAQLAELIESWPDKYKTSVGERGIRLSGGQRQRIGIARALYKRADVLIFDEATSALDNETEKSVMNAITGLSDELTVLIIAHRLTTLEKCDNIVELADGGIRRMGSYADIVGAEQ
jgi:ATP-binding cassette, subfamily B, bacterial PglK